MTEIFYQKSKKYAILPKILLRILKKGLKAIQRPDL